MMDANEKHLLEQLACVVDHYPLFAGDTLSHAAARECGERGWIVRDGDAKWIPTKLGLRVHESVTNYGRDRS